MTKKQKLVWRLRESPTVENIAKLISVGLLKEDEAREILFSSQTEEDRDKKSLQDEIKFLRELVEKLSNNQNSRIVEVIREIEKPVYIERYDWYRPYQYWCTGDVMFVGTSGTITATNATVDNWATCASDATASSNFSDIKTF